MALPDWEPGLIEGTEYEALPAHILSNLYDYVQEGRSVGHFLTGLLENDLQKALGHADQENQHLIVLWARYVYNRLPSGCWGSPEKVKQWQENS